MELDHVFVFTAPGAPAAERLVGWGLREGSGNTHPGQGTANRRFFFRNAMLELIWIVDEAEARGAAGLHLGERSRWRDSGASPFGVCLRGAKNELAFPTWEYAPPYLPPGRAIHVASENRAEEPLLFAMAGLARPDVARREPVNDVVLTALRVTTCARRVWRDVAVEDCTVVDGRVPLLELHVTDGPKRPVLDLRPDLPLVLRT